MSGIKELIRIDVTLCFAVSDAPIFGGVGTTGYAKFRIEDVGNIELLRDDKLEKRIELQTESVADFLGVTPDKLRLISYGEYLANTEEDEDAEDEE